MKQIQRITIRTPRTVQIAFLIFFAIMMTPFFAYIASASSTYCERQFNISFFQAISPRAERVCRVEFQRITNEWKTGLYTNNK